MDKSLREETIKNLYNSLTQNSLPDVDAGKDYLFDETTGTWYSLTGKRQIERPAIENAERYFEGILSTLKSAPIGTETYQKALYCAIAVEAIHKYLQNKKS